MTLGSTARLYEKHEFVFKEANLQSKPSGTCMEVILVMFKLEKERRFEVDKNHGSLLVSEWVIEWVSERASESR